MLLYAAAGVTEIASQESEYTNSTMAKYKIDSNRVKLYIQSVQIIQQYIWWINIKFLHAYVYRAQYLSPLSLKGSPRDK